MKKLVERVFDDLDDRIEAVKTESFTFRGRTYTLDLGEKNVTRLENALEPFITAATATREAAKPPTKKAKTKAKKKSGHGKGNRNRDYRAEYEARRRRRLERMGEYDPAADGPSANQIRMWARDNNIHVGEKGTIKREVRMAFLEAHQARIAQAQQAQEEPQGEAQQETAQPIGPPLLPPLPGMREYDPATDTRIDPLNDDSALSA